MQAAQREGKRQGQEHSLPDYIPVTTSNQGHSYGMFSHELIPHGWIHWWAQHPRTQSASIQGDTGRHFRSKPWYAPAMILCAHANSSCPRPVSKCGFSLSGHPAFNWKSPCLYWFWTVTIVKGKLCFFIFFKGSYHLSDWYLEKSLSADTETGYDGVTLNGCKKIGIHKGPRKKKNVWDAVHLEEKVFCKELCFYWMKWLWELSANWGVCLKDSHLHFNPFIISNDLWSHHTYFTYGSRLRSPPCGWKFVSLKFIKFIETFFKKKFSERVSLSC